jgi:putative chitinase
MTKFILSQDVVQVAHAKGAHISLEKLTALLNQLIQDWPQLSTPARILAFLAQCSHETGKFKWLTELGSIHYFDKYEPGTSIGKRLGNIEKGDGYVFRGRGFIQLTGRHNYYAFQDWLKEYQIDDDSIITDPTLVALAPWNALAAVFFWVTNNLQYYADRKDMIGLTKRINGGFNGLQDRISLYNSLVDAYNLELPG